MQKKIPLFSGTVFKIVTYFPFDVICGIENAWSWGTSVGRFDVGEVLKINYLGFYFVVCHHKFSRWQRKIKRDTDFSWTNNLLEVHPRKSLSLFTCTSCPPFLSTNYLI